MPGWYDIRSLSRSRAHESCDGIEASKGRIAALVNKEASAKHAAYLMTAVHASA